MGGDDKDDKKEESAESKAEKEAAVWFYLISYTWLNIYFKNKEKAAAAEKKALEQERKEMYEKQKNERKEERAKYREKVICNLHKFWIELYS